MRRTVLLLSAVAIFSLPLGGSASAGGWWSGIDLPGKHLGVGEKLTVRSEVMFRTIEVAEKARTSAYYAYLVRGVDTEALDRAMSRPEPKRWWTPPEEMILIGDVELSRWNSNLAIATAHLSIPDIPSGRYNLMLCDAGCSTPLGNLIPMGVRVTPDALAAKTARRLQRANSKLQLALARVRRDVRQTKKHLAHVEGAAAESIDAVGRLEEKLSSRDPVPAPTPWWAFAAWFFGGSAVALAAIRLGRKRSVPLDVESIERVPDDVRELISSR
jgi:hypothetical protein